MPEHHITRSVIEKWPKNKCFVCGDKNISDQHHIYPIEYGGPKEGLTVPLCPTDHRNAHREAEATFKDKSDAGKYINPSTYPNAEQLQRAQFIADYVLNSKRKFVASGAKKADGARNMMQVSFTRQELAVAHDLKKQLGFRSLERMVKYLVLDKWKEKNTK